MKLHLTASLFQSGRSTLALLIGLRPHVMGGIAGFCLGSFCPHGFLSFTNLLRASSHKVCVSRERKRRLPGFSQPLFRTGTVWPVLHSVVKKWKSNPDPRWREANSASWCETQYLRTGIWGTVDGYLCWESILVPYSASLPLFLTSVS